MSSAAIPKQSLPAKPVAKGPQQPQKKAGAAAPNQKAEIGKQNSKASLLIGIAAVVAIAIGAFVFRSGSRQTSDAHPQAAASTTPSDQTLASSATSKSAPIKVRENPKPVSTPISNPKSTISNPTAPPADQTLASSATKGSAPKPAPETKEEPKPAATAPVMPAPAPAPAIANSKSPISDSPTPSAPPSPSLPVSASPSLPPELAALDAQFIKLQAEGVTAPFESDLATLNSGYLNGIGRAVADEKKAGRLDGIFALEAEKKLVTDKQPVPDEDDEKTPASLKGLRAIYRTAYAKLEATRAASLKALTEPLDKHLVAMETEFTKKDRVADAKVVRGYREALGESGGPGLQSAQLSANGGAPETPRADGLKSGTTTLNPAAMLALKDGYTNSLGMKFVLVKGTEAMFGTHEVRYKDYAVYAAEEPGVDGAWKDQSADGFTPTDRPEDHPVMKVSWEDSQKFCAWLSKKEGKTYRLPTDQEWSIAVGIGRDEKWKKDTTPATVFKNTTDFPWGDKWPPPKGSGNFSDQSRKAKAPNGAAQYLEGYDDGFPTTAPVMSFKPNKLGLYDLSGNVWEWCEDWYDNGKKDRVLRGGSWFDGDRGSLLSSYRYHSTPDSRRSHSGFRLVLSPSGPAPKSAGF